MPRAHGTTRQIELRDFDQAGQGAPGPQRYTQRRLQGLARGAGCGSILITGAVRRLRRQFEAGAALVMEGRVRAEHLLHRLVEGEFEIEPANKPTSVVSIEHLVSAHHQSQRDIDT